MIGTTSSKLAISPELSQISTASNWLHNWCNANTVASDICNDLDLVLDELLSNAIDYGELEQRSCIQLKLVLCSDRIFLEMRSSGIAFDPRCTPEPNGAPEDGGGGFGLELVRRSVDSLDYVREKGENFIIVEKHLHRQ